MKFLTNKKITITLIGLLLVILLGFLIVESYMGSERDRLAYNANSLDVIEQRTRDLFLEINTADVSSDILFLSKLSSFNRILNSASVNIDEIERDFVSFMEQTTTYYQLRYIDVTGRERVRVNFDGNDYQVVQPHNLQDKQSRHYFTETMKLAPGEIMVSRLDLNVENDLVENRGSDEEPEYVPVIRYSTPVFSQDGTSKGIIISNIYANYFLNNVKRIQRQDERVFLIDSDGYYLAHPDNEKEFSFMFEDKNDSFLFDYPNIADKILSGCDQYRLETEDAIFTYRCIYPRASSFEIYEGTQKIFGQNSENDYYWVLVTVTGKGEAQKAFIGIQTNYYFWFLLICGLILILIFVLVLLIDFKIPNNFDKFKSIVKSKKLRK